MGVGVGRGYFGFVCVCNVLVYPPFLRCEYLKSSNNIGNVSVNKQSHLWCRTSRRGMARIRSLWDVNEQKRL